MGKETIRTNQIIGYKPRVHPIILADNFEDQLKGTPDGTGTETVEVVAESAYLGAKGLHIKTQPTTPLTSDHAKIYRTLALTSLSEVLFEIFFRVNSDNTPSKFEINLSGLNSISEYNLGIQCSDDCGAWKYKNAENGWTYITPYPFQFNYDCWHYLSFSFNHLLRKYVNFTINSHIVDCSNFQFNAVDPDGTEKNTMEIKVYGGYDVPGEAHFDHLLISEVL